jgi:hypothetical protein
MLRTGSAPLRQVRPVWDATGQEPDMQTIPVVGVDIAKSVFQVHAIGADGEVAIRRRLRRSEVTRFCQGLAPCLVGMEPCASAHHWAREEFVLLAMLFPWRHQVLGEDAMSDGVEPAALISRIDLSIHLSD